MQLVASGGRDGRDAARDCPHVERRPWQVRGSSRKSRGQQLRRASLLSTDGPLEPHGDGLNRHWAC
jgi:hypothetical protein